MPAPLPGAPDIVSGVLNVNGEIVTIVDFCRRMGFPSTEIDPSQRLLILDMAGFPIGFIVDNVIGVAYRELEDGDCVPEKFIGAALVESIVRLEDGLCIIIDPEKFFFEDERMLLGDALEKACHDLR